MKHGLRQAIVAGALVTLACVSGSVDARALPDHEATPLRVGTVAILPAVSVTGDALAEVRAEAGWNALYGRGWAQWVSADEVSRRLAVDRADDFAREVRDQIWRNGTVDAPTAARLCRMLGVDAVLCLRIDRWELEERRGMVEVTASLSGADGPQLWSASGHAGFGRRELPDTDAAEHPDHRTCAAYSSLVARWADQMPASIQEQELLSSVIEGPPTE
jgi:hypothetical protein